VISHTDCDHPSTPSARARCRRARAKGEVLEPDSSPQGATPKVIPEKERNRGKTPRDRWKQCHVCGVERIVAQGKDRLRDLTLLVGEDCFYYLDPEQPIISLEDRG
jgi:hypothetical protein